MEGLRFPIASEPELLEFLNTSFVMNLSQEVFINPTKQLVCDIYGKFLHDFGIENYRMPQMNAVNTDNPNMMANCYAQINLMKTIHFFLSKAGFHEFGFNDLHSPKRKRNQVIFSQLAGLWIDFYEKLEKYEQEAQKYEMISRKKATLKVKIDEQKKRNEEKLLELSRLKQEMRDGDGDLRKAAELLAHEQSRSLKLKVSQEEMKKKLSSLKGTKAEIEQQNAILREEISDYESQLVQSPEKIFAEVKRKEKERDEIRTEKQIKEKQYLDLVNKLNILREDEKDTNQIKKALKEAIGHVDTLKDSCTNLKEKDEEKAEKQKKIEKQDIQIEKLRAIKEDIFKQKVSATKTHEQKTRSTKEMIDEIEKRVVTLTKEQEERDKAACEEEHYLVHQVQKVKLQRESERKEFEKLQREHMDKFAEKTLPIVDKVKQILAKVPKKGVTNHINYPTNT